LKQSCLNYKRIVIKIGSSLFYSAKKELDFGVLAELTSQISNLVKEGKEILIVSSGAIALGMHILRWKQRPKNIYDLQAAAAIGQNELMNTYKRLFRDLKHNDAQVLLTWDDFTDRRRYLNAKNTLLALLKYKCIPIINENDTVSNEEIKFGDNDKLSALVASLVGADLLIILSDVDGLLDKEKKTIRVVEEIGPAIKSLASFSGGATTVGGMVTKLEAAKIAIDSGIPCIIANGRRKNILSQLVKDIYAQGTLFFSRKKVLEARKRWIAFGAKAKGKVYIDAGAKEALVKNKCSLLAPGIVGLAGNFNVGDVVEIIAPGNIFCAKGIISVGAEQLKSIMGKKYPKEIIHRDNLALRA